MSDQENTLNPKSSNQLADERTDLAYERTALANDRTLIAWVRTSVSLISFGFTIFKFLGEVENAGKLVRSKFNITPADVGLILIALGFFCVFFGLIQYRIDMKRIKKSAHQVKYFSFAPILAVIISIFSLLLFLTSVIRD